MLRFLLNLFFVSFLLNFVWEISQMGFYSTLGMGSISDYRSFILTHWEVSLKDALMVVAMYLVIGVILRNCLPTRDVPKGQNWALTWNSGWLILLISLPIWQVIIEYYSVYIYGRWSYAEAMPLVFGIGAVPIIQMLILPSIAVLLSRRLIKG